LNVQRGPLTTAVHLFGICCYSGEGIHHAMEAGKMAAEFLGECLDRGNFDAEVMSIWHDRWMDKFGGDYKWSVSRHF